MSWVFLSYEMDEKLSGYGGSKGIQIKQVRSMCCGDTSNNTEFSMPTHYGTHMDFPFHFSMDGKKSSDYVASDFVFNKIATLFLDLRSRENKLITEKDVDQQFPTDSEILVIKTFYSHERESEDYWKNGPGFRPEVAKALKARMPKLRAIAFDSMSLTNFQNRELGRVAHKAFLMENDILIIEDINLREIHPGDKLRKLIISPLRMKNSDGAPVTVIAEKES